MGQIFGSGGGGGGAGVTPTHASRLCRRNNLTAEDFMKEGKIAEQKKVIIWELEFK